ncbi:MAG: hypothetical protein M1822_000422 [Bathelium mastoideum]|nr:MAG: hypothetical protein M1822_000422 [Bathelium mastoideum]
MWTEDIKRRRKLRRKFERSFAAFSSLRIIRQDAAVATAAGLNMAEPSSTGIGGDMFCLFYNAKTRKVHALNGSGRSGGKVTLDSIRKDLGVEDGKAGQIPTTSVHAVSIPGAPAGWVDTVEKFGSGRLSMTQILAPAIEMGEEGFPVSELSAYFWNRSEQLLRNASPNFAEMLKKDSKAKDGCRAPKAGEIMHNSTLANTFRLLAEHGKKGYYEGPVADALIKVVHDLGGHLTHEDLKNHLNAGSEEVDAISLKFKSQGVGDLQAEHMHDSSSEGVEVWEHPPNGQGIVALMALGMLEQLEKTGKIRKFSEKDHNSAEYLHAIIETLRIAFADGNWWIADPNVSKVPTQELISERYLAERAQLFDPSKASPIPDHGSPAHSHSDTVYFTCSDSEGNAISFINSNYAGFGTGIIPKGCGFTLQNRGANFVLQPPEHPNIVEPNKRPYHTIIPAMVTNAADGSLHSSFGVMGGFMQPQGHVQVLLNQLVFKLTPQAALDAPRLCIGAGMPDNIGGGEVFDKTVYLEDGIREDVVRELQKMGHEVEIVKGHGRSLFGRGQIIRCHVEDGRLVWSAGSDPRGDGAAVPV